MSQISRRDFLKVAGTMFAGTLAYEKMSSLRAANDKKPNIIIVLCDALSARHLSLHGYPRLTSPNIDAFAERSTVFHNHYSGGNFTITGTASMLTGMLPWKHRAINYGGLVRSEFIHSNPYTLLGSDYHRLAFMQNPWPDRLIGQYYSDVDRFLAPSSYSLLNENSLMRIFENDRALASIALEDFLLLAQEHDAITGSSVLGYINKSRILNFANEQKSVRYPKGFPEVMDPGYLIPYLNENTYDGVYLELSALESKNLPYFAYFHLYSPHYPYRPRNDYRRLFRDGYQPVAKPVHPLSAGLHEGYILNQRVLYDRQIAQIDDEFGRLISRLDKDGVLEHSYVIFTSDHGELFERGFVGHGYQFMYESVLRIPLIIHSPGQTRRNDVFTLTSNIDLLPTILSITGSDAGSDIDGRILPEFGGKVSEDRTIFSIVAVDNSAFAALKKAVISMRKGAHKLIAYLGYDDIGEAFELYDLENDPEELVDLASKEESRLAQMKGEFFDNLEEANKPFARK